MFMLNKCCCPHFILESYFASDGYLNKNTLNKLSMVTVHGHSVVASPCFPLGPASSILTAYNDLYINIGTNSFFTLLHRNNQQIRIHCIKRYYLNTRLVVMIHSYSFWSISSFYLIVLFILF